MELDELDKLLIRTPVIVRGLHTASLAFLKGEVFLFKTLQELIIKLDSPERTEPIKALSFDNASPFKSRFPVVTVNHDPFTTKLNNVLFEKLEFLSLHITTHQMVSDLIVSEAKNFETVVLILLDGLSYADCKDWPGVEPCLVVHPSITRIGFPAIIGSPPLASKLFSSGFTKRIGFTYWERDDNPLTEILFNTIKETLVIDPTSPGMFSQIIDWISIRDLHKTYIQIVYSALDEYAEGHRASIPRQAVIDKIKANLEALFDILIHKGRSAILFAISDHGILWKEDGHKIENLNSPNGARYFVGRSGPGRGRYFKVGTEHFWVLDYPQMGRPWKKNEQGIHGGISFEESIVPFIRWEVK
jgi:hypothetical protein